MDDKWRYKTSQWRWCLALSPNNGADQHFPTNKTLPKSGMWKLDAYIGDEIFGSVYVKVHKE